MPMLANIIPFAHSLLAAHIRPGDTVVDATAGQGRDTLFLAQCVGAAGRVFAFDIQAEALAATGDRLRAAGLEGRAVLLHAGHETLAEHIATPLAAVAFNCGYLPGGDKSRSTRADATVAAMRQALALLRREGVLVAVLYPGHAAGQEEADAVCAWAQALPQQQYAVLRYAFINRANRPPFVLAVAKL